MKSELYSWIFIGAFNVNLVIEYNILYINLIISSLFSYLQTVVCEKCLLYMAPKLMPTSAWVNPSLIRCLFTVITNSSCPENFPAEKFSTSFWYGKILGFSYEIFARIFPVFWRRTFRSKVLRGAGAGMSVSGVK